MPQKSKYTLPIAIVVAGVLIATALYFTSNRTDTPTTTTDGQTALVRSVQPDDHILGNPNARIVIVEYSDFECPFCKSFHETMHQVIDVYGPTGDVAWVFRQFPLAQLHSKAPREAQASECAAQLGGNDAFWKYADRIYEITPSNNGLDLSKLPEIAAQIGLSVDAFNACMEGSDAKNAVDEDVAEAFSAGGRGTPHNVIIVGDQQVVLEGAQPFAAMKNVIDSILAPDSEVGIPAVTQ